ncbi:MAG TPA: beta-N-acetylglucosaminidase domain-containing protein [Candidatus Limnocylindrales bacterium]|nr:beta-N-acetylglucosaminidase domain-containing protein [Vitreimonas sp.]HVM24683.1 beta-N-acetylglucosaminidase domain-containing protein [Candidatus Limnocylindrales bacterium]
MTFAIRGIIEGFYGRLWTWDERARVATESAAMGYTVYAWAPKEDRLQNAAWRTRYPPDERRRIAAFVERCHRDGLTVWLGLRPVGISYADDTDVERLEAKLGDHLDLGADGIVLLADDIPDSLDAASAGRFGSLAEAHAWLVERALEAVSGSRLVFCPTEYHGPGGPYLEHLGAAVPREVELFWTGGEVCSRSISAEEARAVGAVLRRPPLVWDNYPVNDAGMVDQLHIGPVRDRDPELASATAGILVNPAMEPEATLVPLATWADYLADPAGYDPDASWRRALHRVAGSQGDADAVAELAAHADRSVIRQPWRRAPDAPAGPLARRAASVANARLAEDLRRFVEALPG